MNEKADIQKLITDHPKNYVKMIKNRSNLWEWVVDNTKIQSINSAEMIYSAIHQQSNVCSLGKTKIWRGKSQGWGFCGSAAKCDCARKSVSASVKRAKARLTPEQIASSNKKREETNFEKWGVMNTGQLLQAKSSHQKFYKDSEKVKNATEKNKATKLAKWGKENYNNSAKTQKTVQNKWGVQTVLQLPSVRQKAIETFQNRKNNNSFLIQGRDRFAKYVDERYGFTLLTSVDNYQGIVQKNAHSFKFRCNKCDTEITKKFYHSVGLRCDVCDPFTPSWRSNEENEVFEYITKDLGITGKQGDRSLINPWELDMLFPDHKIAVEYCGLYWHSEASSGKTKDYHQNKMNLVEKLGWRLITIFSDEWTFKKQIVKSRLRHIFQMSARKVYARSLKVVELNSKDTSTFLNEYHLQGKTGAIVRYGLLDQTGKIHAVMTFGRGRKSLNSNDSWELVRYVTTEHSVVGGASKLLKHFIKTYNPTQIISFSDLRWSTGNLYQTLGFRKQDIPKPSYWYVEDYSKRLHRYSFTKYKLVESGADKCKTELEIMQDRGFDRIWDCGQQKWILYCIE
jgi:hypothetical protein